MGCKQLCAGICWFDAIHALVALTVHCCPACCRLQRDLVAYLQREAKAWEAQARAEGRCSAEEGGEHLPEALLTAAFAPRAS